MSIKAIETRYAGYRFRSRLEARYALMFDKMQWKWEYEPEGYVLDDDTCYLPDFFLVEYNMFAEVKREGAPESDFDKAKSLSVQTGVPVLLLDGTPTVAPFRVFDPKYDEETDCILTNCGFGYASDIYWNVGGTLHDDTIEEMCNGIIAAVDAARAERFESRKRGGAA